MFTQNSAHVSAYVRQVSTGSTADSLLGLSSGASVGLRNRSVATQRINQSNSPTGTAAGANTTGYHAITRTGASEYTNYWPAGSFTNTVASSAPAAFNFHLLQVGPGFGNAAVAASTIGGSLTALDYAALKAAFDAYFA